MVASGQENVTTSDDATGSQEIMYSNTSGIYLYPVCIAGAIALLLVVIRIYTRLKRTKSLYIDDWLIVVAEPISLANIGLGGAAVAYGWGTPVAFITPSDLKQSLKLQFAVQTTWIISLGLVRVSVACSLLRFGRERPWRITLYGLIALQIAVSISWLILQFAQCTPVSSNWEQIPDVVCWDPQSIIKYGWACSGIYITMDLILSFMPIKLIRTLNRPFSEKILISCLMALGLLATAVCAAKTSTFNDFAKGDPMQATIKPSMYAKLEETVGIIACSLPCLKSPVESSLKRCGLLKSHELTKPSFVNTMSLPQMEGDFEDRDSDKNSSMPSVKCQIRVDSAAVLKPGSASSDSREDPGPRRESANNAV